MVVKFNTRKSIRREAQRTNTQIEKKKNQRLKILLVLPKNKSAAKQENTCEEIGGS